MKNLLWGKPSPKRRICGAGLSAANRSGGGKGEVSWYMVGVVEGIDFKKPVLSCYRNFASFDIFGNVTGLREAGGQGTLRAE